MAGWDGRVAILTGGGAGIGLAIAATVVAGGGSVLIGDLNRDRGHEAAAELGQRARFVPVDVSVESDVEALVAAAVDSFGRLDAMFNNAAIGGAFGPITEQTVEAWDETFAVNVRSVFLGTKHAARRLIAEGSGGAIVNTASVAGLSGGGGPEAYSATKAGRDQPDADDGRRAGGPPDPRERGVPGRGLHGAAPPGPAGADRRVAIPDPAVARPR